jgi:hypothetical protein
LLYFLPIPLLIFAPPVLTIFFRRWPRLALFWFGAIGVTLIAWFVVLLARLKLPVEFNAISWGPADYFLASPTMAIDQASWPYALAMLTLLLAIFVTDVVRTYTEESENTQGWQVTWNSWAVGMVYTGVGLIAVLADNLLLLVLGWAAMDLLELMHRLSRQRPDHDPQTAIRLISVRILAIFLVFMAYLSMAPQGYSLEYANLTPAASFWLFLAAGVRLGILPVFWSTERLRQFPANLEIIYLVFPAISTLALLARLASTSVVPIMPFLLVLLSMLAGLLAGLTWLTSSGGGRMHAAWIAGAASLSLVSAVFLQPAASQSWGLVMIIYGGLIFIYTAYHRFLNIFMLVTMVGLTALPLTIAWAGILIYYPASGSTIPQSAVWVSGLLAPVIQTLLLIGFARQIRQSLPGNYGLERWIWLIFTWGLLILPVTGVLIAWWGGLWSAIFTQSLTVVQFLIPGILATLLSGGALIIAWRGWHIPPRLTGAIARVTDPAWISSLLRSVFQFFSRVVAIIDRVLEGSGGILWTLLLITLLVSILTQFALQVGP